MQRVSSVMAFLLRYLAAADIDAEADAVLGTLSPTQRRVLELLAQVREEHERVQRLAQETGEAWSPERYRRAVGLALSRLGQELAQRDLLQP